LQPRWNSRLSSVHAAHPRTLDDVRTRDFRHCAVTTSNATTRAWSAIFVTLGTWHGLQRPGIVILCLLRRPLFARRTRRISRQLLGLMYRNRREISIVCFGDCSVFFPLGCLLFSRMCGDDLLIRGQPWVGFVHCCQPRWVTLGSIYCRSWSLRVVASSGWPLA
jgi:hypothetical protein